MRGRGLLISALLIQLLIVVGMLMMAMMPLWTGRSVFVEVEGVDPRDLMRGRYVRLNYPWNTIITDSISTDLVDGADLRHGQTLYVVVDETDPTASVKGVYFSEPAEGTYIKGMVHNPMSWRKGNSTVELRYGIESFYTNEEDALRIEEDLRADSTMTVHLKVSPGGKARIYELSSGEMK